MARPQLLQTKMPAKGLRSFVVSFWRLRHVPSIAALAARHSSSLTVPWCSPSTTISVSLVRTRVLVRCMSGPMLEMVFRAFHLILPMFAGLRIMPRTVVASQCLFLGEGTPRAFSSRAMADVPFAPDATSRYICTIMGLSALGTRVCFLFMSALSHPNGAMVPMYCPSCTDRTRPA